MCDECGKEFRYPRYNHPKALLVPNHTSGGFYESASIFTAFVRSLGYEIRFIEDLSDYFWTEVYHP